MNNTIRIREIAQTAADEFTVGISFNGGSEYDGITLKAPFVPAEEENLEWYFERWLHFPFTDTVKAATAAVSVTSYGVKLFEQLFTGRDVIREYDRLHDEPGLIEIEGSPAFQALHWETLHDNGKARPLSLDWTMVRRRENPVLYRADVKPSPTLNILLVTARPNEAGDVGYRTISRPLVAATANSQLAVRIDIVRPGTYAALLEHLEDSHDRAGFYHIIHFDLHGALLTYEQWQEYEGLAHDAHLYRGGPGERPIEAYEGQRAFLFFEQEGAGGNPVVADDIADLLRARQIPIAILNACQSGKQVAVSEATTAAVETSLGAALQAAGVQLVLAMGYSVTVTAAELLMQALYEHLLAGQPPATAIRRGRLALYQQKLRRASFGQQIPLEDWLLPVVYQNQAPRFGSGFQGDDAFFAADEAQYKISQGRYGFFGRDIDILRLEKRLLTGRNIQLVRGMGGAGKSTLLHHLAWWWQKTGLVGDIFYFGYDEKAHTATQILSRLAIHYFGRAEAPQGQIVRKLRAERHLLILDNLESITGQQLAVQNTLPPEEQAALRELLAELVGGNSLLLLGSRSDEAWLGPAVIRPVDVYDLPGLDPEAQSQLAEAILGEIGRQSLLLDEDQQEDMARLLKLLGGYPLALEVVLPNLRSASVAAVIEQLEQADVQLDQQTPNPTRTSSILKCIEYSHSNLSPAAQRLLLCLAPFTGVVWANPEIFSGYLQAVQAQPEFADLPIDEWPAVQAEATRWGLLAPHEQLGELGYLRLQPVLPYFLKTRLAAARDALERAFHAHYHWLSRQIGQLIEAKEPGQRSLGLALAGVEYENLYHALTVALEWQLQFVNPYETLKDYLLTQQQIEPIVAISRQILDARDNYGDAQLAGDIGEDFFIVYGNLGTRLLQLQRYGEAETIYKEALTLVDKLGTTSQEQQGAFRATTYHQLGRVAQAQRQWPQAEAHYQQALAIFIEFNDRYAQASTYHQLGRVAQEQCQWPQAKDYLLQDLIISAEFDDQHGLGITLRSLARLWRSSGDESLPGEVAAALGATVAEVQALFERVLEDQAG